MFAISWRFHRFCRCSEANSIIPFPGTEKQKITDYDGGWRDGLPLSIASSKLSENKILIFVSLNYAVESCDIEVEEKKKTNK